MLHWGGGTWWDYWWDNISGNTCPEAGAFGELSYWKFWPVLCRKSQILLGVSGGVVHGELDWVLAEGPSVPHSLEYAKSVLGTLASGESCHPSSTGALRRPVVGLWGSWQGTGSLSRASQKFTGTRRVWTEKEQEDLETGPGVQWWWFQKLSVSRFPVQTCPRACCSYFPGGFLLTNSTTLI